MFILKICIRTAGVMAAILLFSGCDTAVESSAVPEIRPTLVLEEIPFQRQPPANNPKVTITPSSSLTSTDLPSPICPEITRSDWPEIAFSEFFSMKELESEVTYYLNSGGDLASVIDMILDRLGEDAQWAHFEIQTFDLNRDGVDELFLAGEADLIGGVIAYHCADGRYVSNVALSYSRLYVISLDIADINADGNYDLIIHHGISGAFCYEGLSIVGFVNFEFINHLEAIGEIACGDEINSYYQGGVLTEVEFIGGRNTSSAGGISRDIRVVYRPDEHGIFSLRSYYLLPSDKRVHVIEDAQQAFENGNYLLALDIYNQAAYSGELQDIIPQSMILQANDDPAFDSHTHEYLTAIAKFRMIAIYLVLGDTTQADELLIEMEQTYPEGTPGSEFIQLARLLIEEFQIGKSPVDACQSVTDYILEAFPDLEFKIGDWGMSNIYFHNENICPFHPEETEK